MKTVNNRPGRKGRAILKLTLSTLISLAIDTSQATTLPENTRSTPVQEIKKRTQFNTRFLSEFNDAVDLSYFEQENSIPPGLYHVEIVVNQQRLRTFQMRFMQRQSDVVPCFPLEALSQLPINYALLPVNMPSTECIQLAELFNGAVVDYNYDDEALYVTIPQLYLIERPAGFIDPARWDDGINALSMNYTFSASDIHYRQSDHLGPHQYSLYGNLASTLRWGSWRFHTHDAYRGGSRENEGFQHQLGYAKRAIGSLLSELTIGDISTSGDLFESTPIQGVMLRSDDRMYPWTVKGYAPIIRGVANSNAIVTVKQNGNILLEKNVPPGEFRFADISALGYGGDLAVTVKESNGETQYFTVPYSSLPQLIREGYYRYALAAGRVRHYMRQDKPLLLESSLAYGLNNTATLYGAMQAVPEKKYTAIDGGIALNTAFGAFNFELTESIFNDEPHSDQRNSISNNAQLKLGYASRLAATDTVINLVTYTFSGKNHYTLNQALEAGYRQKRQDGDYAPERFSNRIEATLSQILAPGWGGIDFSGWWENYHGSNHKKQHGSSYFLSYRNSYGKINYSLSANRTFTANNKSNTVFYLNLSMPFGSTDRKRPNFNTMVSYSSEEAKLRTGVSGNHVGEASVSHFNAYFRQSNKTFSNFDINVGHTGSALQKSISYSQGMNYYSASLSLGGGAVIHSQGVNFSPWLSDTIALIEAPGAEGARLANNRLAQINRHGYALLSSVTPYEENLMTLDLKGTSASFDISENGKVVVPTAGALVKVVFPNHAAESVFSRLKQENGKYLPFGTHVYDAENNVAGIVGQGGITILSLAKEQGMLEARWKEDGKKIACKINHETLVQQKNNSKKEKIITCYVSHKEVG